MRLPPAGPTGARARTGTSPASPMAPGSDAYYQDLGWQDPSAEVYFGNVGTDDVFVDLLEWTTPGRCACAWRSPFLRCWTRPRTWSTPGSS